MLRSIIFLVASTRAVNYCANDNMPRADIHTKIDRIRSCVADCLGLDQTSRGESRCFYNTTTGKSKGCPGQFSTKAFSNKKVIICEKGFPIDANQKNLKACDLMYFEFFSYNATTNLVSARNQEINESAPFVELARSLGTKVIGQLTLVQQNEQFLKSIADPAKREAFANSLFAKFDSMLLDGLYFLWRWPGCIVEGSMTTCKTTISSMRKYIVTTILSLAKPLKDRGKMFMMMVPGSPLVTFEFGDYFSEISPYVDFFILETNNMSGYWNSMSDYSFNLRSTKAAVGVLLGKIKDPSASKKAVMTINPFIVSFEHREQNYPKLQGRVNQSPKKYENYLTLKKWCKLVKAGSYKLVRIADLQNYAVRDDHLFVYDDVDSLKEKVDWISSFGAGVNIVNTFADDAYGECGCGPLPYLRSVAELLKMTDCEPLSCF